MTHAPIGSPDVNPCWILSKVDEGQRSILTEGEITNGFDLGLLHWAIGCTRPRPSSTGAATRGAGPVLALRAMSFVHPRNLRRPACAFSTNSPPVSSLTPGLRAGDQTRAAEDRRPSAAQ